MTALTVDQARQMGRDRVPLPIRRGSRTVRLIDNATGSRRGVYISVEINSSPICAVVADRQPTISARLGAIQSAGAFVYLDADGLALAGAWLDGYYADATTRSTT